MKRFAVGIGAILFVRLCGAELVDIKFEVCDFDGSPVEGVNIQFKTARPNLVPYARDEYRKVSAVTDRDGVAYEHFECWDGYVFGNVRANGYYDVKLPETHFRTTYDSALNKMRFHEKSKTVRVILFPRRKPVPMYSYWTMHHDRWFGRNAFFQGYDMRLADWLPPDGCGKVADFYLAHTAVESNGVLYCSAKMTFPNGGGAYKVRKRASEPGVLVYMADTNANFIAKLESHRIFSLAEKKQVDAMELLGEDEALVLRTRVKMNAEGKVIDANYSKIYGRFSIANSFAFRQMSFNPVVNDPTLEFDTGKNLAKKQIGSFKP